MKYLILPMLLLAGCASDRTCTDIGQSAQAIVNAAASLPVSAQTFAIEANAAAIAHAVGHDVVQPVIGAKP